MEERRERKCEKQRTERTATRYEDHHLNGTYSKVGGERAKKTTTSTAEQSNTRRNLAHQLVDTNKLKRAQQFRQNLTIPEVREKSKDENKIKKASLRIATLNLQGSAENEAAEGAAEAGKLQEVARLMEEERIDILGLQETKRPMNDVIRVGDYIFVFASDKEPKTKGASDGKYQYRNNKGRCKKSAIACDQIGGVKAAGKGKSHGKGRRRKEVGQEVEHHGVGFAYRAELETSRKYYLQHNSRRIDIEFEAAGGPLHIVNFYAPHMGRPPNERIKFYEDMSDEIKTNRKYKKFIALGDFNARLHARRHGEDGIIGDYVFGRGKGYLEKRTRDNDTLNRDLLATTALDNSLRVMNTCYEKSDDMLITHRVPGTKSLEDIIAHKFATTDHILCFDSRRHMLLDQTGFPIGPLPTYSHNKGHHNHKTNRTHSARERGANSSTCRT